MSTTLTPALPADHKTAHQDRPGASGRGATSSQQRGWKRFGRRAIFFLASGLLVLAAATYWFISTAAYETTDDATVEAHVIQVSPKVSAHVKTVHFDDNYQVKRGELLVELDPRDYDVALDSAVANLASLRSKLTESQAQQNWPRPGWAKLQRTWRTPRRPPTMLSPILTATNNYIRPT